MIHHQGPLAALAAFLIAAALGSAHAAVLQVDRSDDLAAASACEDAVANDCSLRGAILAANGLAEGSTIQVPAGTYQLGEPNDCFHVTGQFGSNVIPDITALGVRKAMSIAGAGAAATIIDGGATGPVFLVGNVGAVEMRDLPIRNGSFGFGGAISNAGELTISDSVVSGNVSDGAGGAIYNSKTLTVRRSTLARSSATQHGGAVFNASIKARTNVTVTDNRAGVGGVNGTGGGIANSEGGTLKLANTIVAGNSATYPGAGAGPDCYDGGRSSTVTSLGYNLIGFVDDECTLSDDTTGNVTGVDAGLAPLADNGGATSTHALLPASPAIDAGDPARLQRSRG